MNMRQKIIEVFTKYGYIYIEACEPNDPDLLKDIKTFNLEFTTINSGFDCPEYKLQGLHSDIISAINMNWGESGEYMHGFVNLSKGEK